MTITTLLCIFYNPYAQFHNSVSIQIFTSRATVYQLLCPYLRNCTKIQEKLRKKCVWNKKDRKWKKGKQKEKETKNDTAAQKFALPFFLPFSWKSLSSSAFQSLPQYVCVPTTPMTLTHSKLPLPSLGQHKWLPTGKHYTWNTQKNIGYM